jgi:acyl carrier protein
MISSKLHTVFRFNQLIYAKAAPLRLPIFQPFRLFSSASLNENEMIEFVEGKVFEVLKSAAKCKHDKLARTATFEDLGFDSLDGVELVLAMEEHFGFEITNAEAEKITSVMDAIQIFHSHVLKRQSLATQEEKK